MKRSIHLITLHTVFALSLALTGNAQYASDNVRRFGKEKMQQGDHSNVHHNTLTASNTHLLPSTSISRIKVQKKVPAQMASRKAVKPQHIPWNRPRVLASNSPKLKKKQFPKRSPALPVVF